MNKHIFIVIILLIISSGCKKLTPKAKLLDSVILEAPDCIYTHIVLNGNISNLKKQYKDNTTVVIEFEIKNHTLVSAEEIVYLFDKKGNLVSRIRNNTSVIANLLLGLNLKDIDFEENMSLGFFVFRIELEKLWKTSARADLQCLLRN